jgi:hypothetical protein
MAPEPTCQKESFEGVASRRRPSHDFGRAVVPDRRLCPPILTGAGNMLRSGSQAVGRAKRRPASHPAL